MKGIFYPDRYHFGEFPELSLQELRMLDPVEDKYYLDYIVLHTEGVRQKRLMQRLRISELPKRMVNLEDPSDKIYEEYFILREQVAREPDAEVLKEAVYEAPLEMARFAFCYLTKFAYPSPWNDAHSYRTYACGWKEGMTTEDVVTFCQEIIDVQGPFVEEARSVLADPPRDHNDYNGERMVSHERAMSEPPYVRKKRRVPFSDAGEYEQARAEVLQLETEGHEAFAAGNKVKAAALFHQMGYKAELLGKYTQRWEALDDYARSCIATAEVLDVSHKAEEAAGVLRRLIKECLGGPEEKVYREHLEQAEAVYRKVEYNIAARNGFDDAGKPIVFYHSFEPGDAEVICRLIEEQFRLRGGKRAIEFRWQEATRVADAALFAEILADGDSWHTACMDNSWREEREDGRAETGNLCLCDLPTMIDLYYNAGNFYAMSPFVDTERVRPELLEQAKINGEVCCLPVVVISERAGDGAAGDADGAAGAAGGAAGDAGGAAGYRTFFAVLSNNSYGLKGMDCLDLQMMMADSDFVSEICAACNAGSELPRVFPAGRVK